MYPFLIRHIITINAALSILWTAPIHL